jgi:peroxiredoxin
MRNSVFIIQILLFFISTVTWAQKVHINASLPGYENAEFRVYTLSDPVTLQLIPVLNIKADSKGSVSFDVPCNQNEQLIIKTGIYKLDLFVERNKTYDIDLPSFRKMTNNEELNPFFQESELIPDVFNDSLCLNNFLSDFEEQFNSVYDSVSARVFFNRKTSEIPLLIDKLNKYPLTDTIDFYTAYVRCRKSILDLMTFKPVDDKIKATQYLNDLVDLDNPDYTELIGQVFDGYLKTLAGGNLGKEISFAINNGSFPQLKDVLRKDNKIVNDQLLEYILLLNLYKEFYSGNYKKEYLIKLIDNVTVTSSYINIKAIADIVLEKISRFIPGNILPAFTLTNQDGDSVSLNDFKGKYILLSFARSDSYPGILEFSIIKMWQNKYEKDIKLLTILTDNDFINAVSKLRKNGFNWELLDGSNNEQLALIYEIRSFPTFFFLNREGKILMAPSLLPSEELEMVISDKVQRDRIGSGLVK